MITRRTMRRISKYLMYNPVMLMVYFWLIGAGIMTVWAQYIMHLIREHGL